MKRLGLILGLATAAAASQAQTFTNVSFDTSVAGSSASFVANGNSYEADITGFNLAAGQAGDVNWIYNFDSNPVPSFTAVTIEIDGFVTNGQLTIAGDEKVFDMSGAPDLVADGNISGNFTGGAGNDPFQLVQTFNFSHPVTLGQVQKDILHIVNDTGNASVTTIKQSFTPVPEPASMVVLGMGALAAIRRRRSK